MNTRIIVLDDDKHKLRTIVGVARALGVTLDVIQVKFGDSDYAALALSVLDIARQDMTVLLLDGTWTPIGDDAVDSQDWKNMDCFELIRTLAEVGTNPNNIRVCLYTRTKIPLEIFPDSSFRPKGRIAPSEEEIQAFLLGILLGQM